jgi:hypothetical protein
MTEKETKSLKFKRPQTSNKSIVQYDVGGDQSEYMMAYLNQVGAANVEQKTNIFKLN